MAWSTFGLFLLPVNYDLLWFIVSGTLCSYNFHWFLTPGFLSGKNKATWSYRHRYIHFALFILSLAGSAWFGWKLIDKWYWLLMTAFVTFLYSAPKIPWKPFRFLKKIALGKTVFLALAWTHIPFILPILFSVRDWSVQEYLFVFNRFYLIYPICILFDYRDRETDKKEGIRSLVTMLPEEGIDRLFFASMFVFFASGLFFHATGFTWIDMLLLFLPGIILLLIYRIAKKQSSDYYYYFLLDGLMMLSGLLWLIFNKFTG
jgi:4-hydroxybenzoate polyprenyltransferase